MTFSYQATVQVGMKWQRIAPNSVANISWYCGDLASTSKERTQPSIFKMNNKQKTAAVLAQMQQDMEEKHNTHVPSLIVS